MEVPNIRITPDVSQKYILVSVAGTGGKTLFLWGNPNAEWHKDIVEEISESGLEIVSVDGGGRVLLQSKDKMIYFWGKSDRFGNADAGIIQGLLEVEYPGYEVFAGQDPETNAMKI
ncbi:MAG: 14 kDa phosphohistidine phosphatase isoform [Parcubacteria group bacterium]|jgi:hypothetical protein|nr:14 kDa phosphohistidine phosphatase isoform [Parcubacteria group bacterium]